MMDARLQALFLPFFRVRGEGGKGSCQHTLASICLQCVPGFQLDLRGLALVLCCAAPLPETPSDLARHQVSSEQLEHRSRQGLGEDIRLLLCRGNPAQLHVTALHRLRHEMVLDIHMLRAFTLDAVLADGDG